MTTIQRAPVRARTLIQRINRKLRPEMESLKTTRKGSRARLDLGYFYVVDYKFNGVVQTNVDVEAFGRELGCLGSGEMVVYDE